MAKNKFDLLLKLESDKEESLRMSYLQANQNLRLINLIDLLNVTVESIQA